MKRFSAVSCTGALFTLLAMAMFSPNSAVFGQAGNPTGGAGRYRAIEYGQWRAQVTSSGANPNGYGLTSGAGTYAVTFASGGAVVAPGGNPGGAKFVPFATNVPITVGVGSSQETVTPTAVSGCSLTYQSPTGCSVTAVFAYGHGPGTPVVSGDAGLEEAINIATSGASAQSGGVVVVDNPAITNTIITAAVPSSQVDLEDMRGPAPQWWAAQPSTLSMITAPGVLTTGTAYDGTAVGTWTNAAVYECVTYVDMLGGESACSPTFHYTSAGSLALTVVSPAASTGAVGWRFYAGASYALAYQIPITAANCTLTTQESVVPACAIGATGNFPTPTVATSLHPYTFIVNVYAPLIQSHTTFAYAPVNAQPQYGFQNNFGPFTATGSVTAGDIGVIGTVNLPASFLNYIGKAIRVSGKIADTNTATGTVTVSVALGPSYTTGTPTTICTLNPTTAQAASAAYNMAFQCDMTTNAAGASGTIMPFGLVWQQLAAGSTVATATGIDTATAAITDAINTNNQLWVFVTTGAEAPSAVQLLDLHIEALN